MTQGDNRAAAEIALLRKDSDDGGMPMGYYRDGIVTEVKGDDDAPHFKQPPFPTVRDLLLESAELPTDSYVDGEAIDVEEVHILTVWIAFTAAEDGAVLSLLPMARDTPEAPFVPISVLDSTLVADAIAGTPIEFGRRIFYPTEIHSPILASVDDELVTVMSFDVGAFKQFRLSASDSGTDIGTGGALVLSASKSD